MYRLQRIFSGVGGMGQPASDGPMHDSSKQVYISSLTLLKMLKHDFINSQDALLPWNNGLNLVIDRYDVRHLLQDLTVLRRKKRTSPPLDFDYSDATEDNLDMECHKDLPSTHDDQETTKRQKSTCNEYQNVSFSYRTEETSTDGRKSEDAMESSEFKPQFPMPDNLLFHLKIGINEELYVVDLKNGKVTKGPYEVKLDATFSFVDNDFLAVVIGKMNPLIAFMRDFVANDFAWDDFRDLHIYNQMFRN